MDILFVFKKKQSWGFVHGADGLLHTETMEGIWSRVKVHIGRTGGRAAQSLQEYLDEYSFIKMMFVDERRNFHILGRILALHGRRAKVAVDAGV